MKKVMKRVITACLAFAMILALVTPASVEAATKNESLTLYKGETYTWYLTGVKSLSSASSTKKAVATVKANKSKKQYTISAKKAGTSVDFMLKVGVLVSGGGTNLQAILDAIDCGKITNAEVSLVISNNPKAYALERAKNHNIEAVCISPKQFENREEFHRALLAKLKESGVELIVLAGFLVAIPPMIVEAYPNKIINIHPSLIPSFCGVGYYGLHVHEKALERGVRVTGATVHFVDTGTDTGPIILQKAVKIKSDDTPEVLQRRVMEKAEWKILPKAINLIANDKVKVVDGRVETEEFDTEE